MGLLLYCEQESKPLQTPAMTSAIASIWPARLFIVPRIGSDGLCRYGLVTYRWGSTFATP
ncbi:hypothetical protein GCM10023189_24490 [Nibrella saemangeumensis]|uniref:Uncharacterized protein n=1 Tax=Nibrella saemangeumensis TaxID=1084526 RepID=A0ABP8MTV0_9BACT